MNNFQLYHDENKQHSMEEMMSALYLTNTLLDFIMLDYWKNSLQVDMLVHSDGSATSFIIKIKILTS